MIGVILPAGAPHPDRIWGLPSLLPSWVTEDAFPGVKRTGGETDYSPPAGEEVRNVWSHTSNPPHDFMLCCMVKHKDSYTSRLGSTPKAVGNV